MTDTSTLQVVYSLQIFVAFSNLYQVDCNQRKNETNSIIIYYGYGLLRFDWAYFTTIDKNFWVHINFWVHMKGQIYFFRVLQYETGETYSIETM